MSKFRQERVVPMFIPFSSDISEEVDAICEYMDKRVDGPMTRQDLAVYEKIILMERAFADGQSRLAAAHEAFDIIWPKTEEAPK